jgi:hypothetical protein
MAMNKTQVELWVVLLEILVEFLLFHGGVGVRVHQKKRTPLLEFAMQSI